MDKSIGIPGTRFRVGIDAIAGLLPVGGDMATGIAQALFVLSMHQRYQLPPSLLRRMAANVAIDFLVGAIPLLGDLFDAQFKANTRNLDLLKQHLAQRDATA